MTDATNNIGPPIPHYVSQGPFDPYAIEELTPEQERYYMASQWALMWFKLKRHRLAVIAGAILAAFYVSILISEFLAPYNLHTRHSGFIYAPPQAVHLFDEGRFVGPFVYGFSYRLNMENLGREYTPNPAKIQPIRFFCRGDSYEFAGQFESDVHLFCPAEGLIREGKRPVGGHDVGS